jgi:hypothetical protein
MVSGDETLSVNDLVDFIQEVYPPSGRLSESRGEARDYPLYDEQFVNSDWLGTEDLPPNLPPTDRPPLPDWLQPGEGQPLPEEGSVTLEEGSLEQWKQPPESVDTLAYYLPFHYYRDSWGIYLKASGLLSVAAMLLRASPSLPASALLDLARHILLEHERFHFLTEVACSRAEVAAARRLYHAYFMNRHAATLEEALANARSHRVGLQKQPASIRGAVERWMLSMGPGYRDFKRFVSAPAFSKGTRVATQLMLLPGGAKASVGSPSEFLYAGLSRQSPVPLRLVTDVGALRILKPFPKYEGMQVLVHTNDHPPPHMHVQIPPGTDYTRLTWPELEPLKNDPSLSKAEHRKLDLYIDKYEEGIEAKIQTVYALRN